LEQRIEILAEKRLIGKRMKMTFSHNKTGDLWRGFMPRRKEIKSNTGTELYSMQIYPPLFFDDFSTDKEFVKWAALEVKNFDNIPDGMEAFTLEGGLYSVFLYRGSSDEGETAFRYIIETWLPESGYELDNRPHFEILGEKYKNGSPDSEEELWIPIRRRI
jgi:AraC family transcriptional regulator